MVTTRHQAARDAALKVFRVPELGEMILLLLDEKDMRAAVQSCKDLNNAYEGSQKAQTMKFAATSPHVPFLSNIRERIRDPEADLADIDGAFNTRLITAFNLHVLGRDDSTIHALFYLENTGGMLSVSKATKEAAVHLRNSIQVDWFGEVFNPNAPHSREHFMYPLWPIVLEIQLSLWQGPVGAARGTVTINIKVKGCSQGMLIRSTNALSRGRPAIDDEIAQKIRDGDPTFFWYTKEQTQEILLKGGITDEEMSLILSPVVYTFER